MAWLVDTNIFSEIRKGDRCDVRVRAWYDDVRDSDLFTSVLVIGEIRRGVESIRRRDPDQAVALDQWLLRLSGAFQDRVLVVDERIAERWGRLNVPDPIPVVDGLLAATAIEHGLTLVTRNIADVASSGAAVLDPFSAT
jgi:predicted nucleic acid-binding protein